MAEEDKSFIRSKFCYTLSPPGWWVQSHSDNLYPWRPICLSDLKDYCNSRILKLLLEMKDELSYECPSLIPHQGRKCMWVSTPKPPVMPPQHGDSEVITFIREYLAVGNPDTMKILLEWFADIVTTPLRTVDRKPPLFLICEDLGAVFKFWDWFGNVILEPRHYVETEISRLVGNFNGILMNKLLVMCNTVPTFRNPRMSTVDRLVTAPNITIQFKKFKPFEYGHCARYVFVGYPSSKILDNSIFIRLTDDVNWTYEDMMKRILQNPNERSVLLHHIYSINH